MASARPRVGYLGPEGTFSEEALLASALADAVEPVGLAGIERTVAAVREGDTQWGVVPIENSLEGSIGLTLDLLARDAERVAIAGEALLRVRHALIGVEEVAMEELEIVLTHPAVPGQCTRFLRGELAHAQVLPASSTAEAVRLVAAAGRREQAALGTALAARVHGGVVLREGVEDRGDNETRFVWVGRAGEPEPPPLRDVDGEWKTSLVFWGAGAERAGWLVRCLDEFARRKINLTRIESRPQRRELGSYRFFADLGGRAGEAPVDGAIAGLRELCEGVHVLGTYRAARRARAGWEPR